VQQQIDRETEWAYQKSILHAVPKCSNYHSDHNGLGDNDKDQRCHQNVHMCPQKLYVDQHPNACQKKRCKKISNRLHLQHITHTIINCLFSNLRSQLCDVLIGTEKIKLNESTHTCSSVCSANSVVEIMTPATKAPSSKLSPSLSLICSSHLINFRSKTYPGLFIICMESINPADGPRQHLPY